MDSSPSVRSCAMLPCPEEAASGLFGALRDRRFCAWHAACTMVARYEPLQICKSVDECVELLINDLWRTVQVPVHFTQGMVRRDFYRHAFLFSGRIGKKTIVWKLEYGPHQRGQNLKKDA